MKTLDKNRGARGAEAKGLSWRLKEVTFVFFLLFLFFLPLYEAPKNIFSVLFVFLGGWVAFYRENAAQRFRSKDLVAWAFLLLAISPFIAGWNSPYMDWPSRLSSALNWALMPLVALVVLLVNFSKAQLLWALRSLCLGAVVAVGEAFHSWSGTYPELNSVGHVNQSALYLAFCLIPATLLLMRYVSKLDLLLGLSCIFAVFSYQAPALSMVGFGTSLAVIGGMFSIYCWNRRHVKTLFVSLVSVVVMLSFAVTLPPQIFGPYEGFKRDFDMRLNSKTDPYSQRDRLVYTAIEVASDSFTGFGLGSFRVATQPSEIKKLLSAQGRDWLVEQGNYFFTSHGHNIFANVLVERGWAGIFSISIFLWYLAVRFFRTTRIEDHQIGIFVVALICLAGLGQSTLHVEHGQLALICLGLCLVLPEH